MTHFSYLQKDAIESVTKAIILTHLMLLLVIQSFLLQILLFSDCVVIIILKNSSYVGHKS